MSLSITKYTSVKKLTTYCGVVRKSASPSVMKVIKYVYCDSLKSILSFTITREDVHDSVDTSITYPYYIIRVSVTNSENIPINVSIKLATMVFYTDQGDTTPVTANISGSAYVAAGSTGTVKIDTSTSLWLTLYKYVDLDFNISVYNSYAQGAGYSNSECVGELNSYANQSSGVTNPAYSG